MRSFILPPEESLLSVTDPFTMERRINEFVELTGIDAEALLVSPYLSLPLPIYPAAWPEGHRRWPKTKPEAMWNPLLWLPVRVGGRFTVEDEFGGTSLESDAEWSVRVALELEAFGLYNPDTGEWADVLENFGLSVDNPEDVQRVQRWLWGQPDEVLDNIDLDEYMTLVLKKDDKDSDDFGFNDAPEDDFGFGDDTKDEEETPEADALWSFHLSQSLLHSDPSAREGGGQLQIVMWAQGAGVLQAITNEARLSEDMPLYDDEGNPNLSLGAVLDFVVSAADSFFEHMPSYDTIRDRWDAMMSEWDGFEQSLRDSVMAGIEQSLSDIEARYEEEVQRIAAQEVE